MHDRPSARRPRQGRGRLGTAAVFLGLLGQAEPLALHILVCAFRLRIRCELGALCAFFGLASILLGSRGHDKAPAFSNVTGALIAGSAERYRNPSSLRSRSRCASWED